MKEGVEPLSELTPPQILAKQQANGDHAMYVNLAGFRVAIRQFLSRSEGISSAAGITSQQYQLMLVVQARTDGTATLKEIAEEMLLLPHGAVQIVDRLESSGLLKRRRSPLDKRNVLVSLTVRGRRILRSLAIDHLDALIRQEPLLAESLRRLREISGS